MAARRRIIEQVHGILAIERIGYSTADDASRFVVPVPQGSAIVHIEVGESVAGQTQIRLTANVLEDVEVRDENRLEVLEHLNALNLSAAVGRFYLDADRSTIVLAHELLADDLDGAHLMAGLYTLGLLADQTDDELQRALGTGRRAVEHPHEFGVGDAWAWPATRYGAQAGDQSR